MSTIKVKKYIFVQFQKEGVHKYPEAATAPELATNDWDDVSFLAVPHRHIFHFKLKIEVLDDNREIEFIQCKRQCEKWYNQGTLELNNKSCEMMASDLYELASTKWPNRDMIIEVSEDGENGAIVEYFKDFK